MFCHEGCVACSGLKGALPRMHPSFPCQIHQRVRRQRAAARADGARGDGAAGQRRFVLPDWAQTGMSPGRPQTEGAEQEPSDTSTTLLQRRNRQVLNRQVMRWSWSPSWLMCVHVEEDVGATRPTPTSRHRRSRTGPHEADWEPTEQKQQPWCARERQLPADSAPSSGPFTFLHDAFLPTCQLQQLRGPGGGGSANADNLLFTGHSAPVVPADTSAPPADTTPSLSRPSPPRS